MGRLPSLTEDRESNAFQFLALVHRKPHSTAANEKHWHCEELPPPPYVGYRRYLGIFGVEVNSYALVGSNSDEVCISTQCIGTYCFDTASGTWSNVHRWVLPFFDKIERDLDPGFWVGFRQRPHHRLHATRDLFSARARGPIPCGDAYQDLKLPYGLHTAKANQLVSLGSGRFCATQFFNTRREACSKRGHEDVNVDG
ncbi:hypothetical protein BAE44_0000893, partial [Dichanthelium oligosanthes]